MGLASAFQVPQLHVNATKVRKRLSDDRRLRVGGPLQHLDGLLHLLPGFLQLSNTFECQAQDLVGKTHVGMVRTHSSFAQSNGFSDVPQSIAVFPQIPLDSRQIVVADCETESVLAKRTADFQRPFKCIECKVWSPRSSHDGGQLVENECVACVQLPLLTLDLVGSSLGELEGTPGISDLGLHHRQNETKLFSVGCFDRAWLRGRSSAPQHGPPLCDDPGDRGRGPRTRGGEPTRQHARRRSSPLASRTAGRNRAPRDGDPAPVPLSRDGVGCSRFPSDLPYPRPSAPRWRDRTILGLYCRSQT